VCGWLRAGRMADVVVGAATCMCACSLLLESYTFISYRERMKTIARSTKNIRVLCLIIQKQVGKISRPQKRWLEPVKVSRLKIRLIHLPSHNYSRSGTLKELQCMIRQKSEFTPQRS
jgi:hypothetical protein